MEPTFNGQIPNLGEASSALSNRPLGELRTLLENIFKVDLSDCESAEFAEAILIVERLRGLNADLPALIYGRLALHPIGGTGANKALSTLQDENYGVASTIARIALSNSQLDNKLTAMETLACTTPFSAQAVFKGFIGNESQTFSNQMAINFCSGQDGRLDLALNRAKQISGNDFYKIATEIAFGAWIGALIAASIGESDTDFAELVAKISEQASTEQPNLTQLRALFADSPVGRTLSHSLRAQTISKAIIEGGTGTSLAFRELRGPIPFKEAKVVTPSPLKLRIAALAPNFPQLALTADETSHFRIGRKQAVDALIDGIADGIDSKTVSVVDELTRRLHNREPGLYLAIEEAVRMARAKFDLVPLELLPVG